MIRIATLNDAEQLIVLNDEFNGKNETTLDCIKTSLLYNNQEIVTVAEEDGILVGFVCVQLKKSFCYKHYIPEITEVYVKKDFRKRGIASAMISFAENYCITNYQPYKFEILTGKDNKKARSVYQRLGYFYDEELHLTKRIK